MQTVITEREIQSDPQPTGRPNHGRPWTPEQKDYLKSCWLYSNKSFEQICAEMGRSYSSIICKLGSLELVAYHPVHREYRTRFTRRASAVEQVQETIINDTEETTMTANIETKVFINGVDASQLTDEQIFQRIAKIEGEIDKLKATHWKKNY